MIVSTNSAISLDAAVAMTGRSKRTWWRRIEDGEVVRQRPDVRGRTMLTFADVQQSMPMVLEPQEVETIIRADGGDGVAQAEVGALFALGAGYIISWRAIG